MKSKKRKRKKRLSFLRILIELIILYFFSGMMFSLGLFTGIMYLISISLAVFNGMLFRKKGIAWMIVLGTFLTFTAGKILLITLGSILAGNILGGVVFFLIAVFIWTKGKKLKKGGE